MVSAIDLIDPRFRARINLKIVDNGLNPIITISNDDMVALMRWIASMAGYDDRQLCAVQVQQKPMNTDAGAFVDLPFDTRIMVSNIPDSRLA